VTSASEPDNQQSGSPKRGWRGPAALLISVFSWLSLALVVGVWALLRAGDLWGPATAVMFGPRWLLALPPALLIPIAAILRRRSLGPLLLAVVLTVGPVTGGCVPWDRLWSSSPQGPRLRVMTCNMHATKVDPAPLVQLLAESRPDIVALQEWWEAAPANVFPPDQWHVNRVRGQYLASRYPILLTERVGKNSDREEGAVVRYELATASGVITVFSLHFATPRNGLQDVAHGSWSGMAELDAGSRLRGEQSERLARKAGDVAGPVLLMGDFNTPPESAIFRRVWAPFTDAFTAAGWGWGYTFESKRVAVRIDHILTGRGLKCDRCWVAASVGSPHRPVLADIVWPPADVADTDPAPAVAGKNGK
jgi:vancomycin resistance protein VanJ